MCTCTLILATHAFEKNVVALFAQATGDCLGFVSPTARARIWALSVALSVAELARCGRPCMCATASSINATLAHARLGIQTDLVAVPFVARLRPKLEKVDGKEHAEREPSSSGTTTLRDARADLSLAASVGRKVVEQRQRGQREMGPQAAVANEFQARVPWWPWRRWWRVWFWT